MIFRVELGLGEESPVFRGRSCCEWLGEICYLPARDRLCLTLFLADRADKPAGTEPRL